MAIHEHAGDTGVHPLRFAGEHKRPLRAEELVRRRPLLGTMKRPDELEAMARRQSVYVRTGTQAQPQVSISRVEDNGDQRDTWRIDIPMEQAGAVQGRTSLRRNAEEFLKEIDPNVDFRSWRPDWADALPVPRVLPSERASSLVRLDRRRLVTPFQTTRFPPEERQVYRDASWPWGLVCKIFTSAGLQGSGVLVGNRTVVTAGHMLPPEGPWWIRVVPAYFDGASLHGANVQSFVSDSRGYRQNGVVGYDWAVLRLYEPLGSWLGFFGFNGYDDDWEDEPYWTALGYPGAISSERPSFQTSVSIFDDDSDSNGGQELETRADLGPGNSGGPYFGWWAEDPRILGVVSGEEYDSAFPTGEWGNVIAGGAGLGNLISWARTNWP
jgi:Trypsin